MPPRSIRAGTCESAVHTARWSDRGSPSAHSVLNARRQPVQHGRSGSAGSNVASVRRNLCTFPQAEHGNGSPRHARRSNRRLSSTTRVRAISADSWHSIFTWPIRPPCGAGNELSGHPTTSKLAIARRSPVASEWRGRGLVNVLTRPDCPDDPVPQIGVLDDESRECLPAAGRTVPFPESGGTPMQRFSRFDT
jgi:hypothetical protein